MTIATQDITGLVLAGGRGSRMGGVDKGLQNHQGRPLALHALRRLQLQVGPAMVNANRNLAAYEAMGVPVWPDAMPDETPPVSGPFAGPLAGPFAGPFAGPLAGLLAGLAHCKTPYLVTVPCDTPGFPADLVERLASALEAADASIAMAATQEDGRVQVQPVFCLLKRTLMESLAAYLQSGQRKIDQWTAQHLCVNVLFDDTPAFFNANTVAELQRLQAPP
jgi:molybdenum cofactor guanylyltransferase